MSEHNEENDIYQDITFMVNNVEYPNNIQTDAIINLQDLNEEYMVQPQRAAWYFTALELSVARESELKVELRKAYAHIDAEIRPKLKANGIKVTEKMVENMVITHHVYNQIQDELLGVSKQVGLLKAARDVMIHRRDMLISLGANYRAEINSDPTMKLK